MAKLAFYTQTHCAERFVRRTIESILNQTYQDFVYYISDDGSTDATPDIIMEYAKKDARIIPCISEPIGIMKLYVDSLNRIWNESGAEYFAILDHDDVYAPDFARKMIFAMEKEKADMAVCGSLFADFSTGSLLETRAVVQDMVIEKQDQAEQFPQLFQFYRTLWGKVYKIDFLKQSNIQFRNVKSYGTDTVFCLDCVSSANRFFILHEPLHTYYIHGSSISHKFSSERSLDDWILYQESMSYLEKIQGVSQENISFILSVYFYAAIDNIRLICNSKLPLKQIFDELNQVFTDEKFLDNWKYCGHICENIQNKTSILNDTKIKLEQYIIAALKRLIYIDSKYKKQIFDIACIFCPELNEFFDENNIKSFLSQDMICNTFFGRNFSEAYQLIEQSCDFDCLAANRILYHLKVYLSAILHKENGIVEAYIEENRRKTDGLTEKRILFLSEYSDLKTEQSNMKGATDLDTSEETIQSFDELMEFVRSHSEEEILKYGFKNYLEQNKISKVVRVKKRPLLYQHFMENCFVGLFKSQFVGGGRLTDTIGDIKAHIKDYVWLYQILEDEKSRKTLFYILMYRIFLHKKYLSLSVTDEMQYFDSHIIPKHKTHVFVDCGAFTGDSATDFIKYCAENENYKRIYCYEPAPDNYAEVVETMSHYHDIIFRNKGVFDKHTQMHFTSHMPSAGNRINPRGDKIVETVDIDSDIKEPVTFIKMDIESAEPNALLGARRHITEDKPILAICVYHTVTDLLKIPQIIYEMNSNQKFFLRHHGHDTPEEIVFYAIPKEKYEKEDNGKNTSGENPNLNILLQQMEQLAELYDTIGEGIVYVGEKIKEGNLKEAYSMMPLIETGLEQEISFIKFLLDNR